jgi:hypothetical protein
MTNIDTMKEYSSFEEIDRDLEILKLQTQIDKEAIKLCINQTKENLSPFSLLGSAMGTVVKKAMDLNIVSKIFRIKQLVSSFTR